MENIAKALAAAQTEMGKAQKDSTNPHFRSKYADLGNVMDACLPALNKHGIAVIQTMEGSDIGRFMVTRFIHESGESLDCPVPLIIGKNDMQGLGSAMTYARRYGLMALAGIAPDDDDGNAAVTSMDLRPKDMSWSQTVLQELPPNATDEDKARALTEAIKGNFKRKKTDKQLSNEWDRRKVTIEHIGGRFPAMKDEIIDAYETKMMSVSEPTAADYLAAE